MKQIHLLILTPERKYLETDVDFILVKSEEYWLGLLPNHAPLLTTLDVDKMTLRNNGVATEYAVSGGILHILEDRTVHLLVNAIERKDEIDVDRAKASEKRAEDRLASPSEEIDIKRAKLSLLKALNRISVATGNK